MYDVRLIHSEDTEQWVSCFARRLQSASTDLRIVQIKDSSLIGTRISDSTTRSSSSTATTDSAIYASSSSASEEVESKAVVVVIVSPLHVGFLHRNLDFRYDEIVFFGGWGGLHQLVLCGGVEAGVFDQLDGNGQSIGRRFPNFDGWKQVTENDSVQVVANIVAYLDITPSSSVSAATSQRSANGSRKRRKTKFTIKPNVIESSCSTLLTILLAKELTGQVFDESTRNDLEVIFDENGDKEGAYFRVNAERCNPDRKSVV